MRRSPLCKSRRCRLRSLTRASFISSNAFSVSGVQANAFLPPFLRSSRPTCNRLVKGSCMLNVLVCVRGLVVAKPEERSHLRNFFESFAVGDGRQLPQNGTASSVAYDLWRELVLRGKDNCLRSIARQLMLAKDIKDSAEINRMGHNQLIVGDPWRHARDNDVNPGRI